MVKDRGPIEEEKKRKTKGNKQQVQTNCVLILSLTFIDGVLHDIKLLQFIP